MFYVIKFIESIVLPPGIFIILLLLVSLWMYRHSKKQACLLALVTAILYLSATPFIANALIRPLETMYSPPRTISGDVLVMLGGGATYGTPDVDGIGNLTGDAGNRLMTTARLYKQSGLPIIVTSGPTYYEKATSSPVSQSLIARRQLISLGIPADKILTENNSLNTTENAKFTKPLLISRGFTHPILVTSAYHMKRSVMDFQAIGVTVQPYPADYKGGIYVEPAVTAFYPSAASLSLTETALHEYLGVIAATLIH